MKVFICLLSMLYANSGSALGLSEAELQSHLGENLLAIVNIISDSQLESNCFTVTDTSDTSVLKDANISIKYANGLQQLIITTNDAVTEPIVNVKISFHCEPNLIREYVLLLDPPLPVIEKSVVDMHANVPQINLVADKKIQAKGNSNDVATQDIAEDIATSTFLKKVEKKKMATYREKQTSLKLASEVRNDSNVKSEIDLMSSQVHSYMASKPLLVISGGSAGLGGSLNNQHMALLLSTEIGSSKNPYTITLPNIASPSITDASDDAVAMANRIEQLEKKILSLQNSNAQLLAASSNAKDQKELFSWKQMLQIIFVIIAAMIGIEWLRSRIAYARSNEATFKSSLKAKNVIETPSFDFHVEEMDINEISHEEYAHYPFEERRNKK